MKASEWIDRAKAVNGWESDYRAAKELGLSRSAVSGYRSRTPTLDEETSVIVADALGENPAIILADQAMERARNEHARSAWQTVLKLLNVKEHPKTPDDAAALVGTPHQVDPGVSKNWRKRRDSNQDWDSNPKLPQSSGRTALPLTWDA
jgi:hypothetical protein